MSLLLLVLNYHTQVKFNSFHFILTDIIIIIIIYIERQKQTTKETKDDITVQSGPRGDAVFCSSFERAQLCEHSHERLGK